MNLSFVNTMNIRYITLILSAVLLLASPAWAQPAQQAEAELGQIEQQLEGLFDTYNKKILEDAENKGARSMLDALSEALNMIEAYQTGDAKPSRIYMAATRGVKEAKRYNTDDARSAVRLLKRLKVIAPKLPGADNDTEAIAAIQEEEDPTPSVDDLPPAEVEPKPTEQPAEQPQESALFSGMTLYILIGNLVLIVVVVVVFSLLLKRATRASMERIVAMEKRLENLEYVGDSASSVGNVKTHQVEKKVKTLEKNTMGFMEALESRISEVYEEMQKLGKNSGQHVASTQQLSEELESVKLLKTRLDIIEARVESGASDDDKIPEPEETETSAVKQIVPTGIVRSRSGQLIDLTADLKEKTNIAALNRLIGEVTPGLEESKATGNLNDINLQGLAEIIQLAFVSGQNEDQRALYEKMSSAIEQIGFKVTDKMTGRQAFSDYYAENIPYDQYITMPKVRTETYPDHAQAKQEMENSALLHDSLKNTVLYTLRPTVQLMERGAQRVLAKGEFVVQA